MKKFLFSVLIFSQTFFLFSQTRVCGTMDNLDRLNSIDPLLQSKMAEIENQTDQFIQFQSAAKFSPTPSTMAVINIPVVVHVLYNTSTQNISDAQILSQITILNNDFRRLNADKINTPSTFSSVAADCEFNFCLASVSPTGASTTGITRTFTSVTSWSANDQMKSSATGGVNPWPTDKYLNIWVCNLGGGLLGYAQFPGGSTATDGVVIGHQYFGNTGTATAPFNKGRTGTHEVGHWLNLRHIWGDAICANDFVSDTPTHYDANYGCPSHPKSNTCGASAEMFMNYMDYTDDACMNMFTLGQKSRMQALFATGGARASLLTSNGCGSGSTTTCGVPAGLNATSITSNSVTTTWTSVTGASSYNVRIKAISSTTWTNTTSTTTSKGFTGLSAGTGYEFQVQSVCSGSTSAFSASKTFTTTAATTGATLTVGTGTTTTTVAPYGTYYMDEKVQFIVTKTDLVNAGYTSANNVLKSLSFNVSQASSQVMNSFTIKMKHTSSSSFSSTSFLSSTGMTTVFSGNVTAVAGWNTHNFTTNFNYNGSSNVLIEICWNNSSYTSDTKVFSTTQSANRTLYLKVDVASGGVCANTTGTLSTARPNMRFFFSGTSSSYSTKEMEQIDVEETDNFSLNLYPNPVESILNIEYSSKEENSPVAVTIFNLMGEKIFEIHEKSKSVGINTLTVNFSGDDKFATIPAGVYLCNVSMEGISKTTRIVIQK
ncbi:MAG: M43 family zinc metalloprotease [Bacteroidota bacterium]|jgi:hypothetical protein